MKCIYASKLYKSSKRKAKIEAALFSMSNAELVQQLADSLDEEYMREDLLDPNDPNASDAQDSENGANSSAEGEGGGDLPSSLSSGMSMGSFNPETDLVEYPEGEEGEGELSDEETDEDESTEEASVEDLEGPDVGVKEATQIKSCTLDAGQLNILKDTLNLTEGLAGVSRVVLKDNELWIYYNDNINLNNIMTDVIEFINQMHSNVEFNRLARSDNAIVFECNVSSLFTEVD